MPDSRAGQRLFPAPAEPLTIHEAVEPEPDDDTIEFGDVPWHEEKPLTLLEVLQAYYDGDLIADEKVKANVKTGIDYIVQAKDFGPEDGNWSGAVALLNRIESMLDNEQLIEHEKWA